MGPPRRPRGHVPPKPAGQLEPWGLLTGRDGGPETTQALGSRPRRRESVPPAPNLACGVEGEGLLLRNYTDSTEISWLLRLCGRGGLEHATHSG